MESRCPRIKALGNLWEQYQTSLSNTVTTQELSQEFWVLFDSIQIDPLFLAMMSDGQSHGKEGQALSVPEGEMGVKSSFSSFYLQARAKRRLDHFICRGEFDSYLFRLGYELFQPWSFQFRASVQIGLGQSPRQVTTILTQGGVERRKSVNEEFTECLFQTKAESVNPVENKHRND